MILLEKSHPLVNQQFLKGHFTAQKSQWVFLSMTLDQNHEHTNELIKGEGGAVGLMENQMVLLRWIVAGPEDVRLLNEFETTETSEAEKHHEDKPTTHFVLLTNMTTIPLQMTGIICIFLIARLSQKTPPLSTCI